MAQKRLDKTLADYLAIAVSPVLIMLLVGSLVFFLQELFSSGVRYESRVRWILFWFVFGMVLISRIAIESGRAQSGMFTLGLAGVTALAIFRFVDGSPWGPLFCLAVIWWCTDKLTWDCTLIDEREDASGEGLLQVAGVDDGSDLTESETDGDAAPDEADAGSRIPLWKRLFLNVAEREGRPHAPGLWVVYFSLAALPIFGFGQTLIPPTRTASRQFAFNLLLVYVAAGLGLLLLTSFLGLRRYLRQRQLQMPSTMAASWVGMGATIAIGILIVALLMPRPQGDYSVIDLIDRAGDRLQDAAEVAFLNEDGGQGDGQRSGAAAEEARQGAAPPDGQPGQPGGEQGGDQSSDQSGDEGQSSDSGESPGPASGNGQNSGQSSSSSQPPAQDGRTPSARDPSNGQQDQGHDSENQSAGGSSPPPEPSGGNREQPQGSESSPQGDRAAEPQHGRENAADGEAAGQQAPDQNGEPADRARPPEPDVSPPEMNAVMSSIGDLFKWVMYGLLALVTLWLIYINREAIAAFLSRLRDELLGLFGRRKPAVEEAVNDEPEPVANPRPFAAFRNPFASGAAGQHSPSELVRYTFEALQAWGFEHGCPRSPDQTPLEYGHQLRNLKVPLASDAHDLSQLYARVAYAGYQPRSDNLALLERVWRRMGQTSAGQTSAVHSMTRQ